MNKPATTDTNATGDGTGTGTGTPDGAARVPHRDLLTPAQLADRWGVTTGHLANLRHHGEGISYLKIGSRIAYRYADVIAFENQHYVAID